MNLLIAGCSEMAEAKLLEVVARLEAVATK